MPHPVTIVAFGVLESAGPSTAWLIVTTFVFLECAFIVGMFLPGDSMLFGAGLVLAKHGGAADAWALSATATALAIAGNQVGYHIGRRTGTRVWARKGGRVLNRQNLERAHRFFERWGFWAVVVARWLPWIRTLAPLVAGAARMDRRVFLIATIIGAVAWVPGLILLGFYGAGLLELLPWLETLILTLVVACFTIAVVVGLWRYRQDIRQPVDEAAELPEGIAGRVVSDAALRS